MTPYIAQQNLQTQQTRAGTLEVTVEQNPYKSSLEIPEDRIGLGGLLRLSHDSTEEEINTAIENTSHYKNNIKIPRIFYLSLGCLTGSLLGTGVGAVTLLYIGKLIKELIKK